ncbi:unnamed protein product [Brassica oleracea var. botrytis]
MLRLASFQWKLLRAVSFLPEKSSKLNENSSFVKHRPPLSLNLLILQDEEETVRIYLYVSVSESLLWFRRNVSRFDHGNNLKALAAQKNLMISPMSLKDRVYPQAHQKLEKMKVNQ